MIKSFIILVALSALTCENFNIKDLFNKTRPTAFKEITVSGEKRVDLTRKGSIFSDNKLDSLFFFAVPFTFQPLGLVLSDNRFAFDFANYENELVNRKAVRENAKIMEEIPELKNLMNYNKQYSAFVVNFDLIGKEFFIETFRVTGNTNYITLTIKITANQSQNPKEKYSMHFRMIFEIDVRMKEIEAWTEYIISLVNLPEDVSKARNKIIDLYEVERKKDLERMRFLNK